jgi:hypothetical protein
MLVLVSRRLLSEPFAATFRSSDGADFIPSRAFSKPPTIKNSLFSKVYGLIAWNHMKRQPCLVKRRQRPRDCGRCA